MTPKRFGIIAEWNPFHKGHAAMIRNIKESMPEAALLAVISGSFVQRGEPSLFDKWSRARWAVQSGIDAVFELPLLFALQSADRFSEWGSRLLFSLGCNGIYFGTESLEREELLDAAAFSMTPRYTKALREALHEGLSYAQSAFSAMSIHSSRLAEELSKPNNLLGYRYTETILRNGYEMEIYVYHRDVAHNISASAARGDLLSCNTSPLIPPHVKEEAESLMESGNYTDFSRYEDACLLVSRLLTETDLAYSGLFKEGLEHKWYKESQNESYSLMLDQIKSKRYLYSRLKRTGAALLLSGRGKSPFSSAPCCSYARLLALRKEKSGLLASINIPLITSYAKALRTLPSPMAESLMLDGKGTDVRACFMKSASFRKSREDFYHSPEIL